MAFLLSFTGICLYVQEWNCYAQTFLFADTDLRTILQSMFLTGMSCLENMGSCWVRLLGGSYRCSKLLETCALILHNITIFKVVIKFWLNCTLDLNTCNKIVALRVNYINNEQGHGNNKGPRSMLSHDRCYRLWPLLAARISCQKYPIFMIKVNRPQSISDQNGPKPYSFTLHILI